MSRLATAIAVTLCATSMGWAQEKPPVEWVPANPAYHALHHELLGLLTKYDPAHAA